MNAKRAPKRRRFKLNTPAEEAQIQAGIKADPDNPEWTKENFARAKPFREAMAERRRGRPPSTVHKEHVNMRLDAEILEFFRGRGQKWQTRVNAVLLAHVRRARREKSE
jgi:uncharacterized protein (DUF4415 family)